MKILEAKKKKLFYQVYPSIAPPINPFLKHRILKLWVIPPPIILLYSLPYVTTYIVSVQFSSVQFSHVQLFATPWTAACQASLSITNSQSLLRLTSIMLMMLSTI